LGAVAAGFRRSENDRRHRIGGRAAFEQPNPIRETVVSAHRLCQRVDLGLHACLGQRPEKLRHAARRLLRDQAGLGAAEAGQLHHLRLGEFRADRNCDGASAQNAEEADSPLRPVFRDQHHPVVRLDPTAKQERAHPCRIALDLAEAEALRPLGAGAAISHQPPESDPMAVCVDRGVEQLQQIPVRHAAGAPFGGLFHPGEDPLLQPRKMDLEEVMAPIEARGLPVDPLAILLGEPGEQRPGVVAAKDVSVGPDERQEEIHQNGEPHRLFLHLVQLGDRPIHPG